MSRRARYTMALTVTLVATLIALVMREAGDQRELGTSSIFLSAVLIASWYGGLGPGLLAVGLSVLSLQFFFVDPKDSVKALLIEDEIRAAVFLGISLLVVGFSVSTRLAHVELERNRANLSDFLENSAIGLHWLSSDGSILWANRAEMEMMGFNEEEYIGHQIAEFYEDKSAIDDIAARLRRGETLHDYPARLRAKDGRVLDVLIDSNVLWEDGNFIHTRSFTRDVTEQRRAHEALLESDARLQAERTEVQRLYESESKARAAAELAATRTAVLQSLSAALVEAATPEQVGSTVLSQVVANLGAFAGRFMVVDSENELLHSVADQGFPRVPPPEDIEISSNASRLAIAVSERRGIFISSGDDPERLVSSFPGPDSQSWACIPLFARDEVIAVMGFSWKETRQFPPDEIDMIFAFGRLASQALERARLYSAELDLRRRAEQATSRVARLQAVTVALSETMTQTQVGDVIVREGMSVLGASAGLIALLDRGTAELALTAQRGYTGSSAMRQRYGLTENIALAEAVKRGQPLFLSSREDAARFAEEVPPLQQSEASWALIPIIHNDETFGVLGLAWQEAQEFAVEDTDLMQTLARQTGQALERARLYQSEQQARRNAEQSAFSLARLHASLNALARALTSTQVAEVIVKEGLAALRAKAGGVHLLAANGEQLESTASIGYASEIEASWRTLPVDALVPACEAVRSRQSLYVSDRVGADQRAQGHADLKGDAFACVPLIVEDQCFGALTLLFDGPRSLNAGEKALIEAFANQGAQALDRARLYAAEKEAREQAEQTAHRIAQIQSVTAALAAATTREEVERVFASQGILASGAQAGVLYGLSPDKHGLVPLANNWYPTLQADALELSFERFPLIWKLIESSSPLFLRGEDSLSEQAREMIALHVGGSRAWALLPLSHELGNSGMLALSFEEEPDFDEGQREMLRTLGRLFGQALERTRLYDAERELRSRLNAVLSDVPGVVWEAWEKPDPMAQHIDFVSDYVEQMLGYSVGEWLATPNFWLSIVHPEDREAAAANAAASLAGGQPSISQSRWIRKDGSVIHVLTHSSVIADAQGRPLAMRGVSLDITEQKRAEEALRESELRARAVLDTAANGILTVGDSGQILTMNLAAERIFGYDASEARGSDLSVLLPSQQPPYRGLLESVPGSERRTGREVSGRKKDGSTFPLELSLSEVTSGERLTYTAIVNDISERRRAQSAIEFLVHASDVLGSSLDYETALKNLADLAVPQLGDFCAVDVLEGERLERLAFTHREGEKIELARTFAEKNAVMRQGERFRHLIREFKPRLLADIPAEVIETIRDPERREIAKAISPRSAMAVPLVGHSANLGLLTFVMAESGRHYDAQDLALATELGRRAGIAIENARLYRESQRIQAELRRSNEAKDEFLGMVSHELRTPISSIYGGARFLHLRSSKVDAETRSELIITMEREAERLYRLVENLLALARLELGREVPTEPVLIGALVEGIATAFRAQVPNRELKVRNEAEGIMVSAEPTYVEQVLQNLLSNAAKYSPADSTIHVVIERRGDEVTVRVLDRGHGISPDELNLIFDSFYRSSRTAGKAPGKGLGLTVCRRLVEAQHGRIWAENRHGGGLEVAFGLPLLQNLPEEHMGGSSDADGSHAETDAARV